MPKGATGHKTPLAAAIWARLREMDMSQATLCARMAQQGVSQSPVSRVLTGTTANPTVGTFVGLCRVLCLDPSALLGRAGLWRDQDGRVRTEPAMAQPHPAIAHLSAAAHHLDDAALDAHRAASAHERGEHETAAELDRGAHGHIGQAQSHLRGARAAHAAHSRTPNAHPPTPNSQGG